MIYYLIDFENVKNIQGINDLDNNSTVIFFYSKNSNTLNFSLHREINDSQANFKYIEIANTGKNALDFQLSSYLGYLIGKHPQDKFKIVSKDLGFDNVVEFWSKVIKVGTKIERIENINLNNKAGVNVAVNPPQQDLSKKALIDLLTKNASDLELKKDEIVKIAEIVDQYKSRQSINANMVRYFKNTEKVGKINKVIRPFLKTKS